MVDAERSNKAGQKSGGGVIRFLLVVAAIGALFAAYRFGWLEQLSLSHVQSQLASLKAYQSREPLILGTAFGLIYVLVTAASIPGAAVLTLLAGALFGLGLGTAIVSLASTIGASLAFLLSRFLFAAVVRRRFAGAMRRIDAGVEKDGWRYLLTLRLVPVVPFFAINAGMGLTSIPLRQFFWVSQLGMLPGTLVYVNAGKQLGQLESISGILSPEALAALLLLGLFPFLAKFGLAWFKRVRAFAPYKRPKRADYNLVVIGAGSGGLVSAYIAAAVKSKVLLVERDKMGGDCLNTGCVPSKALIRAAKQAASLRAGERFGVTADRLRVDFSGVMAHVRQAIADIEPHDSVERYRSLGVEVEQAEAHIRSPFELELKAAGTTRSVTTRAIIVATGARPLVPPIDGLKEVGYLTSDSLWDLAELPRRLLVLGGGPIGSELAQAFARLGSVVTLVERLPRILSQEDPEVSELAANALRQDGVSLLLEHTAVSAAVAKDGSKTLQLKKKSGEMVEASADAILVAVGRKANTTGFGLEELGVRLAKNGTIDANSLLQTTVPNIFVCGDVTGPFQFTHAASHQAWYATLNALLQPLWSFDVDYRVMPWVTYLDPEVATVGLTESEAQKRGTEYELTEYHWSELDRAIAEHSTSGLVRVLTVPGRDTILGATIVGAHAGELLPQFALCMKHKLGLKKLLSTTFAYPTLSEATKATAGA